MAYNTKPIVKDVDGNPISQYYNPDTDSYEPVEGSHGANKVMVENNDLSLIPILDKLSQLTDSVIGRTTFHCTALPGYKIVQSNCFVVNNIAYVNLEVRKNDETAFDIISHQIAQFPYGITGLFAHLLANGLDNPGYIKAIQSPVTVAGWNRNIIVRPVDTGATRIFISGSFPIVI